MSLIIELTQTSFNDLIESFDSTRNCFSYEAKQALFDYLSELNLGFDIAMILEWSEYTATEFAREYSNYTDIDIDDIKDNEYTYYEKKLIEDLEDYTTIIKLNSGDYLVNTEF